MRKLFLAVVMFAGVATATPALAWSEANCRAECRATATDVGVCIQKTPCSRYQGGQNDPGKLRAAIAKWNSEHGTPAARRARVGTTGGR